MSASFGVHFGNTSSCVAVYRDGITDVIANDLGDRVTPCIVAFTDHDQAVGAAAKQGLIRNVQNSVCNVKQVIGRRSDDPVVTEYKKKSAVKVVDKGGLPAYEVEYKESTKQVTPLEIAETIFRNLLETAQSHGGSGIKNSVLTVPLSFNTEQKEAVRQAATKAGFKVLRLISEPSAAVLASDLGQKDISEQSIALVFRLGGLSSDASLVQIQSGLLRILASCSTTELGGDKFTDVLTKHLATEFQRINRCNILENHRSMAKLHRAAETCKYSLSTLDNSQCSVDSLHEGLDFNSSVSRARFESLCSSLVQQCTQLIDKVLKEANLSREAITEVILCGGGTKIPFVQRTVRDLFPDADLLNSINPDEVLAVGAAKQAAMLSSHEDEDIRLNAESAKVECISKTISIKSAVESGDVLVPVFPKLSPLHSRKHMTFNLGEEQTSFLLEICEVDGDQVITLAQIVMRELNPSSSISTTFHLRREGSLHVTCMEEASNKTDSVIVEVAS
ncbi:hypothetical protein CHS0354_021703 [Potamilus streckersoni]|uniref:Heat shock 70 kDa protein 14 n=1 Tax=Potamilus streckersoni TaxID=2493646 RepID=A0AAE0TKJ8_9BIVA|nr:hypothetical protein CHS0354_021703 [Potamilus streckersoni]